MRGIIIRHRKENLKKCSLRGLESHPKLDFHTYPLSEDELLAIPGIQNAYLLDFEGEAITEQHQEATILLLDGTWKYAEKMRALVDRTLPHLPKLALPSALRTAYPRKQEDCADPSRGLASVEALYASFTLAKDEDPSLIEGYYWREAFLQKNFT